MKRLRVLCDLVVEVYGPANRAAFSFMKALEPIEHLEQELATQAAWDAQGQATNDLHLDGGRTPAPMIVPPTGSSDTPNS